MKNNFENKKVLAFGDSITEREGWVSSLSKTLGTEVINKGVGGDTTIQAIRRYEADVLENNPDIVIMMFGMNDQALIEWKDMEASIPLDMYEDNYRKMIEAMKARGIDVVLLVGHDVCNDEGYYVHTDFYYGTGNIVHYYDLIRKFAKEYNLNLIDLYDRCLGEGLNKMCDVGDGVHLSKYGHDMYAKWIGEFMLEEYEAKN